MAVYSAGWRDAVDLSRLWNWTATYFGDNSIDDNALGADIPTRKFPPTIYGGPEALKAIGRTGDEELLETLRPMTASPRKGNVAEAFEALRFWRAVYAALEEARSTDGTQKSTGQNFGSEYNYAWYGFSNPTEVTNVLFANIITTVASNVSTLVDYHKAFAGLMSESIWEDLKYWAFATYEGEVNIPKELDRGLTMFYVHDGSADKPSRPSGYASRPGPDPSNPKESGRTDGIADLATGTEKFEDYHTVTENFIVDKEYKYRPMQTVWISGTWNGPPGYESKLLESGVIDHQLAAFFVAYAWWDKFASEGDPSKIAIVSDMESAGEILFNNYTGTASRPGRAAGKFVPGEGAGNVASDQYIHRMRQAIEYQMNTGPDTRVTSTDVEAVREFVKMQLLGDKATKDFLDTLGALFGVPKIPDPPPLPEPKPVPPVKVESASIWDQQCFLIENIKKITAAGGARLYRDFGVLNGAPGNLISALHRGSTADPSPAAMLNLAPEVYALMVPYIRLYRVLYDKDNPLMEIGEAELPFESFTRREDLENIFTDREARQAGAGLKSFSWKLDGVQPEEVDNNISATLEVHFQSVYDLFRHNINPEVSDDPQAGLENPGFLDLIIAPETHAATLGDAENSNPAPGGKGCNAASKIYDGQLYRIKAVVGWSAPDGLENLPGVSNALDLQESLENQKKTLFLQLARHAINFQQDGTVKLTVEYQAALHGILRSAHSDVLAGPEMLMDIFADPDSDCAVLRKHKKDLSGKEKETYKKCLDIQIAHEREDRLIKYQRVLKGLYDRGQINSIRVGMHELLLPSWRELSPEERARRAKRRQSTNPKEAGYTITASGASTGGGALYEALENAENGEVLGKEGLAKIGKGLNSIKDATPSDYVDINYFYLGDLIASVLNMRHIKKEIDHEAFQLVVGTLELIDPLMAYQISNISQIAECRGLRNPQDAELLKHINPFGSESTSIIEHIDMASVPISMDAFNQWFFNKVVKKNLTKYHLDQFIRDILGSLVGAALSSRCLPGIPQVPLRFATNDFFIEGDLKGARHDLETVREQVRKKMKPPTGPDALGWAGWFGADSTIPTLFIYSTDSLPQGHLSGDPDDDLEKGIYHFYLGSSAGLVKSINFNREDMPGFREAKIQKEGSLGALQLRELYSVKLSLIGNNLLKNGQIIYINPSAIGAGSPSSDGSVPNLARLLGLGGYFLVTSVSHQISDAGFTVDVTALHQDISLNEQPTIPITPFEGLTAERVPARPKGYQNPQPPELSASRTALAEAAEAEALAAEESAMGMGVDNAPAPEAGGSRGLYQKNVWVQKKMQGPPAVPRILAEEMWERAQDPDRALSKAAAASARQMLVTAGNIAAGGRSSTDP